MNIKVDDTHYEVPDPVANRMQEYYDCMDLATKEYNKLLEHVKKVRRLQKEYFANRDTYVLRSSKVAEKELDEYLEGKEKKNKDVAQASLFS
jgi:hypothetical protein